MKFNKRYFLKHLHNIFLKYFYKYYSTKPKVFGIGLNKTGTSSLGKYFEILGYSHSFETYSEKKLKRFLMDDNYLFREADRFDMHEDWPWPFVYKKIFFKYPDAKFILTLRENPEKWFYSLLNTTKKHGPSAVKKLFYKSDSITEDMKERLIKQYNNHLKEVEDFFNKNGKDRLYILHLNDNKKENNLCDFLEMPSKKSIQFPHAHKGKY